MATKDSNANAKAMTVRLSGEQAEELEAVAQVEGVPISEVVRTAIGEHIAARRKDTAFKKRLRASLERNKEILARLAR
jgi:predicted transcriptional regulator